MKTSELYDKSKSVAFYQERYSIGYMDGYWPVEKERRVVEVIKSLGLPDAGEAIDYGCGNGTFAEVLRMALPQGWKVFGTDISEKAIENAKKHYPRIEFFVANNDEYIYKKFDFLFTHHVLEHVFDLPLVLDEINDRLKNTSTMLHILPCGNIGSFEYNICLLRKDGIDSHFENRFFYEDVGHVRRLNSEQLIELCKERHFVIANEFYSNQYYGAINWITTRPASSLIRLLTDTTMAINSEAKKKLKRLRYNLLFYWQVRHWGVAVMNTLAIKKKTFRNYIGLTLRLPLFPLSKLIDSVFERKALNEWNQRKKDRNGGEMYLFFKR